MLMYVYKLVYYCTLKEKNVIKFTNKSNVLCEFYNFDARIIQIDLSGTRVQLIEALTKPWAFIKPKPNLLLNRYPAVFICQPSLSYRGATSDVNTIKCCTSLHVKLPLERQIRLSRNLGSVAIIMNNYFASNASAIIPAANGADADVPVCLIVHSLYKSVVAFTRRK